MKSCKWCEKELVIRSGERSDRFAVRSYCNKHCSWSASRDRGSHKQDMTGAKFGSFVVIRQSEERNNAGAIWVLKGECGHEIQRLGFSLRGNRSPLRCEFCNPKQSKKNLTRKADKEPLQDIGDELGVSKQYASVIEERALRKLRSSALREWRDYEGTRAKSMWE